MSKFDLSKAEITKIESLPSEDAKWVNIQKIHYNDPNGKARDWEFCSRKTRVAGSSADGVAIIAILNTPEAPRIVLQKQFRPPVDAVCIEIPAGLLDPNETLEECAVRELFEETGYVGTVVKTGPVIFNDPGFCNTNTVLVTVNIDPSDPANKNPVPNLTPDEFIECFTVPLADLPKELETLKGSGYAIDARIQNVADGIALARQYGL